MALSHERGTDFDVAAFLEEEEARLEVVSLPCDWRVGRSLG